MGDWDLGVGTATVKCEVCGEDGVYVSPYGRGRSTPLDMDGYEIHLAGGAAWYHAE